MIHTQDVGTATIIVLSSLFSGIQIGPAPGEGTFFNLSVRGRIPGSTLPPSAWSPDLSVTIDGPSVPTNLAIT